MATFDAALKLILTDAEARVLQQLGNPHQILSQLITVWLHDEYVRIAQRAGGARLRAYDAVPPATQTVVDELYSQIDLTLGL